MHCRNPSAAPRPSPRAPEPEDFLRDNYRLACQAVIDKPEFDVEFTLLQRRPKILTTATASPCELDPQVARAGDKVLYDGEAIDEYRGHIYGAAIDVGTTTIVIELVDLETGRDGLPCLAGESAALRGQRRDAPHLVRFRPLSR